MASKYRNQLCPLTMQRIEKVLRERGVKVNPGDLRGWRRGGTSMPDEDKQWDCYGGYVRSLTVSLTLEV